MKDAEAVINLADLGDFDIPGKMKFNEPVVNYGSINTDKIKFTDIINSVDVNWGQLPLLMFLLSSLFILSLLSTCLLSLSSLLPPLLNLLSGLIGVILLSLLMLLLI